MLIGETTFSVRGNEFTTAGQALLACNSSVVFEVEEDLFCWVGMEPLTEFDEGLFLDALSAFFFTCFGA